MKGESCTEVLAVLAHMEDTYQYMVPERLVNMLKLNQAKGYRFEIDVNKPLKDQNLSHEALAMLALINLNYWCKDEVHKQELLRKYEENDRKYEEQKRLEYRDVLRSLNPMDTTPPPVQERKEETSIVTKKEETILEKGLGFIKGLSFYDKVMNAIKGFFS